MNVVAGNGNELTAKEKFEVAVLESVKGREKFFLDLFRSLISQSPGHLDFQQSSASVLAPSLFVKSCITDLTALELQSNAGAHHNMVGEVDPRIVVELPEPMVAIVIDANACSLDKLAGVTASRLKNSIKGDSVIGV